MTKDRSEASRVIGNAIEACIATDDGFVVAKALQVAIDAALVIERETPEFFTMAQLAERWQLERKAVERLNLPRTKIGGSIRFERADVLAFEREGYLPAPRG